MALDKQSIEKRDFPTGSHGYDPQAVDAHLSALAEEITEFKSAARRRSETVASSASDQVRAIIEAAEASAAEIQRAAESEAREIREEAHHEAHVTRERATEDVREHVSRVSEATGAMLGRLEGMEAELSSLLEALRNGAGRLDGDLRELGAELENVAERVKPPSRVEFQPDPPPAPEPVETASATDAGDGWGASTTTGDWGSSETEAGAGATSATSNTGWGAEPGPPEQPGWGESSAPTEGAAPSWDAGAASPGWGAPVGEPESANGAEATHQESYGSSESYGTPDPAPSTESWQHTPEAPAHEPAPAADQSFPDSPSAPPGHHEAEVSAPYGAPSSGSFGDPGHEAAAPHDADLHSEDSDDSEGARLIALNMALNGTPRDETARYLSENFQLADRDGLLDEVYASVEG